MAMLVSTSRYPTATAIPGTWPSPSNCTSRIATIECANVATNSPMASWLGLSRRNVCTIRGENCPIANCTTTIVIVNTSVASDTIDTAIVVRIPIAASGPPVSQRGITSNPSTRSTAKVPTDSNRPASTQRTGMNQRLDEIPDRRAELDQHVSPARTT